MMNFDLLTYLSEKLLGDATIKQVHASAGSGEMDEVLRDIRGVKFPLVMVDIGSDGVLDYSAGSRDRAVQSFYVLYDYDAREDSSRLASLAEAKAQGKRILAMMQTDSKEYGQPCYGVDFSDIRYYKVALGGNSYGYCFAITCTSE